MKKERFQELLTDLYNAYNPDFIKYVPELIEKYHHMVFDSVQNIMIKYNHESYAHYDPIKSTDDFILALINDYNNGNRTLEGFTLDMQIKRNKEKEALEQEEQASKKTEEELSEIKNKLKEMESESKTKKSSAYDEVEISIKSNYTESELILPNKEVLAGLGKGTRLIVQDKSGKMVGLIVDEILYDCISHPTGIPIIEIILNKG